MLPLGVGSLLSKRETGSPGKLFLAMDGAACSQAGEGAVFQWLFFDALCRKPGMRPVCSGFSLILGGIFPQTREREAMSGWLREI